MAALDTAVQTLLTGAFGFGGIWLGWRLKSSSDDSQSLRRSREELYGTVVTDVNAWERKVELLPNEPESPDWEQALVDLDEARHKVTETTMLTVLVAPRRMAALLFEVNHAVDDVMILARSRKGEDPTAWSKAIFVVGYMLGAIPAYARADLGIKEHSAGHRLWRGVRRRVNVVAPWHSRGGRPSAAAERGPHSGQ